MKIELRNIGPVNRATIDLDRLAVLVGPNASGKTTLSTAAYATLLAYDAAEWQMHAYLRERTLTVPPSQLRFGDDELGGRFAAFFRDAMTEQLQRCYSPDLSKLPRRGRTGNGSAPRIIVSDEPPGEPPWTIVFRVRDRALSLEPKYPGYASPVFDRVVDPGEQGTPGRYVDSRVLSRRMFHRRSRIPNPIYFPAARSGYVQMQSVLSSLLLAALGRGYFNQVAVGKISGVAADFLQFLAEMDPSREADLPQAAVRRLEQELLQGHLRIIGTNDTTKELEFAPAGLSEYWPMDSAATSIAELAPLLLYLRHRASSRDLLLIDEPEAHLHPKNQLVLADVLLDLSTQIQGMVIGTHSEFFATGVSNSLLRRSAQGEQVSVTIYGLVPAKSTGGFVADAVDVDDRAGFSVEQFSNVADAAMDEAEELFERNQHRGD